jgi:hypothetical protein
MNDVATQSEPAQSLKRPLDDEQVEHTYHQPQIQPDDSTATKVDKTERNGVNGVNGANGIHHEASDSVEPAAKRAKLDNGEPDTQSHKVDARDKVKGVALVKEE